MGKIKDLLSGMFNPLGKQPEAREAKEAEPQAVTPPAPQEEEPEQVPEEPVKTPEEPVKVPEEPVNAPEKPEKPKEKPVKAPKPEKPQPAAPVQPQEEPATLGNFKDLKELEVTIADCLVKQMGKYVGGSGYPDLTVWIDDPVAAQLTDGEFVEFLRKRLLHNGCRPQNPKAPLVVRAGAPAAGVAAETLTKKGKLNPGKVFVTFRQEETVSADKAVLSICRGKGSLADSSYILDPSVKTRYRIGRGEDSSRPEYSFRVNDIIIKTDDPEERVQNLNDHVSSAHADLVYQDGRFYLQVLPPGCAVGGNITRIVRDQKPFELDNPSISYPLADGDLIELGGTVLLEFKLQR